MNIEPYANYADLIFHKLYHVRIPVLATYSDAELDLIGIPMNVIDGANKDVSAELTDAMLPISRLAELYNNGFKITLIDNRDINEIYNAIDKHLQTWQGKQMFSLNVGTGPVDDLKILDKFANEMFSNNKVTIVDELTNAPNAYTNAFSKMLMSPVEEVAPNKIIYADVKRESLSPKIKRKEKYDLNNLLK